MAPVAGAHLNFRKFLNSSVILQAKDKRVFFVINRGDYSRLGTTERMVSNPEDLQVTEAEIDYLLGEVNRYFPSVHLTRQNIIYQDAGIRPLVNPKKAVHEHSISREHAIQKSPQGIYHLIGVKLTDHRRAAQQLLNLIIKEHFPSNPRISSKTFTHQRPL